MVFWLKSLCLSINSYHVKAISIKFGRYIIKCTDNALFIMCNVLFCHVALLSTLEFYRAWVTQIYVNCINFQGVFTLTTLATWVQVARNVQMVPLYHLIKYPEHKLKIARLALSVK